MKKNNKKSSFLKKIIIVIISIIIALTGLYYTIPLIIGMSLPDVEDIGINETEIISPNGDYLYKPFGNYYIKGSSYNNDSLVNGNGIVDLEGTFYSFAKYESFLAIHNLSLIPTTEEVNSSNRKITYNSCDFYVEKEEYYILNNLNQSLKSFSTYDDFLNYCKEQEINFDNWQYRDIESNTIQINKRSYIRNCGDFRNQYIFIDNTPVFEGVIDKYAVLSEDKTVFSFENAKTNYAYEFKNTELISSKFLLYDYNSNSYKLFYNENELIDDIGNIEWKKGKDK